MLTTESSEAMKAQGRAAGATGWLVKPFDPQKLIEVVKRSSADAGRRPARGAVFPTQQERRGQE